jgi:hypothetical protein
MPVSKVHDKKSSNLRLTTKLLAAHLSAKYRLFISSLWCNKACNSLGAQELIVTRVDDMKGILWHLLVLLRLKIKHIHLNLSSLVERL